MSLDVTADASTVQNGLEPQMVTERCVKYIHMHVCVSTGALHYITLHYITLHYIIVDDFMFGCSISRFERDGRMGQFSNRKTAVTGQR